MMTAFIAHDIAGWIGVPVGVVIFGMIVLRKQGKQLRARRQHQRTSPNSPQI